MGQKIINSRHLNSFLSEKYGSVVSQSTLNFNLYAVYLLLVFKFLTMKYVSAHSKISESCMYSQSS